MRILVTTGQKHTAAVVERGRAYAEELHAPFSMRDKRSLDGLKKEYGADVVVVARKSGVSAYTDGGELFFHLNMAQLRLKNLRAGGSDPLLEAMQLKSGMTVLDCTLGMGTDAVMESFVSGASVVALESSPVIGLVVREGMHFFQTDDGFLRAALDRIAVVCTDYNAYLPQLGTGSFDVVYLDPMFRHPLCESRHLRPLRQAADMRAVTEAALREAERVAKKRVVLKEANGSGEFARLGIKTIVGGKYSSIAYGVVEVGG